MLKLSIEFIWSSLERVWGTDMTFVSFGIAINKLDIKIKITKEIF